ncbi:serine/arginine repetitive matrix protein 1 [Cheilinus undulatus]|uniref:serine/arginine repetitive matrix protein 1 n=1 Tax=Cheilinus undulatus TaxID=241271 RepID=UPI001BD66A51|nr:serine/arginine repetitive matrix protein 1 [Cheilinus undulatus]
MASEVDEEGDEMEWRKCTISLFANRQETPTKKKKKKKKKKLALSPCGAKSREVAHIDSNNMEEGDIVTAETEQEDVEYNEEEEPEVEMPVSSPVKRGRGRPAGPKKLKAPITDNDQSDPASGMPNGETPQPKRGRGRPRLSDANATKQQESEGNHADDPVKTPKGRGRLKGSKNRTSNVGSSIPQSSPKKRGRPKKSISPGMPVGEVLANGVGDAPVSRRGRPKGSGKRKLESDTGTPKKRGRPKGSTNKKPRLELTGVDGINIDGSTKQLVKRGRGRPKGSSNKKVRGRVGRPPKVQLLPPPKQKRGRPKKEPAKRGRPRKYPLPSPDEVKRPKVWKPLGRPRKYPRVDPPGGALSTPKRSRGRPRKSESKKGAHLRIKFPIPSSLHTSRKRGRPSKSAQRDGETPKKRGRPKGSRNKTPQTQIDDKINTSDETTNRSATSEGETPKRRGRPKLSSTKRISESAPEFDSQLPEETADSSAGNMEMPPIVHSGSAQSEGGTRKKRGRPKASVKNNKSEIELNNELANRSQATSDSVEEKEVDQNVEMVPIDEAGEMFVEQDAALEVSYGPLS